MEADIDGAGVRHLVLSRGVVVEADVVGCSAAGVYAGAVAGVAGGEVLEVVVAFGSGDP